MDAVTRIERTLSASLDRVDTRRRPAVAGRGHAACGVSARRAHPPPAVPGGRGGLWGGRSSGGRRRRGGDRVHALRVAGA